MTPSLFRRKYTSTPLTHSTIDSFCGVLLKLIPTTCRNLSFSHNSSERGMYPGQVISREMHSGSKHTTQKKKGRTGSGLVMGVKITTRALRLSNSFPSRTIFGSVFLLCGFVEQKRRALSFCYVTPGFCRWWWFACVSLHVGLWCCGSACRGVRFLPALLCAGRFKNVLG